MRKFITLFFLVSLPLLCVAQGKIVRKTKRVPVSVPSDSPRLSIPTTPDFSVSSPDGYISGHGYVDLGLSVRWATCNVGASSPSGYGDYFAWGEISTKSEYTKENSKTYGKTMDDIAGDSSYDAARANWGGSWRLPTKAEYEELKNRCTWTWGRQNGHNGYRVQGPNGNSIFLPAAVRYGKSELLLGAKESGNYWSSTPSGTGSACYLCFGIDNSQIYVDWRASRYVSQTVRPVSEYVNSIVSAEPTEQIDSIKPTGQAEPTDSFMSIELVDSKYSLDTIVSRENNKLSISEPDNYIANHGYVDLGLPSGLKWATCNVGAASNPFDYGAYYAWGGTYKRNIALLKKGKNDIAGNPKYDAARAYWGATWRLPTKTEFEELIKECIWTYTSVSGLDGYRVQGPNGKSIFFSAAGCRVGLSFLYVGKNGFYWSSTPIEGRANSFYLSLGSGGKSVEWSAARYCMCSVRPVSE